MNGPGLWGLTRRRGTLLVGLALLAMATGLGVSVACGASRVDAPPDPPWVARSCLSPRELAPAFYRGLETDRYAGLREVIESSLSACTLQGVAASCSDPRAEPPVVGVLLARIFATIVEFTGDPAELVAGTHPGEEGYCAAHSAQAETPSRFCGLRRAVDRLILSRGSDGQLVLQSAFVELQPLLADLFRYMDGGYPAASGPRYSDLPVLRTIARRCGGDEFVSLVEAFLAWLSPSNADHTLEVLLRLLRNPDAVQFLEQLDVQNGVGQAGFVSLGRLLLDAIRSDSFDPANLTQLMDDQVYPLVAKRYPNNGLEQDLRAAVEVLLELVDPLREPSILLPLQQVLDCHAVADPEDLVLEMIYDLSVSAAVVHVDTLVETMRALLALDPEGELGDTTRVLFTRLAQDQALRDALRRSIDLLLLEENARRLVPVSVDVLDSEVPSELVGIADALLGGCRDSSTGQP